VRPERFSRSVPSGQTARLVHAEKNQTPLGFKTRADFGERGLGPGIVHSAWATTTVSAERSASGFARRRLKVFHGKWREWFCASQARASLRPDRHKKPFHLAGSK